MVNTHFHYSAIASPAAAAEQLPVAGEQLPAVVAEESSAATVAVEAAPAEAAAVGPM